MKHANHATTANGHEIYRDPTRPVYHIFTQGVGWWAFDIPTLEEAVRKANAVNPPTNPETLGDPRRI